MSHRRALLQNAIVGCIGAVAFGWALASAPIIVADAVRHRFRRMR